MYMPAAYNPASMLFFFFSPFSVLLFAFRPGQQPWLLDGFVFVCPQSFRKYAHKLLLHMIYLPLLTTSAQLYYSHFLDTWRSCCTWLLIHCSVLAQWHTFWLCPSLCPPTLSPLPRTVAISLTCPHSPHLVIARSQVTGSLLPNTTI